MSETLKLFDRAAAHGDAVAIRSYSGEFTYQDLLARSSLLAGELLQEAADLQEARVAILIPAGEEYVIAQWAIWRAGGMAVPLCLSAAEGELEYVLTDSEVSCIVTTRDWAGKIEPLAERLSIRLLCGEELEQQQHRPLPIIVPDRRAMILYTSGTTSRPKGVVSTHANIQAQIQTLVEAWQWEAGDCIPLFLPLHHIHGIINVLACALWTGAKVETFTQFELDAILSRVAAQAYTVFMAVPTIYVKLIQAIESKSAEERAAICQGFAQMRLMVSGSAALPASVHEKWEALTGQKLLERYGMTEIGMALSNAYLGERRPGAVGVPLPGVEVRLVNDAGDVIEGEDSPGEIQVRGPAVFREYWQRPEATIESFIDAWFRTGDVAVRERGYYRILGRQSVDIIKSGGYKLSALEIEATLLQHPSVRECAVIGVEDETWGEAVAVVVVPHSGCQLELEPLRDWCRDRISHYKIPKRLVVVEALPRNAMGKVTKPAMRDLF